jgi:membrane protein insertase Oxa1/YidC/SpoIIIJ
MDETQAKMMKTFMPIFFTVIMLFLPAGLTLYIFINTIVGIFHQWLVYRRPEEVVVHTKKTPKKASWMEKMSAYVEEQQKEAAKRNAANAKNPDQPKKTPPKKKS